MMVNVVRLFTCLLFKPLMFQAESLVRLSWILLCWGDTFCLTESVLFTLHCPWWAAEGVSKETTHSAISPLAVAGAASFSPQCPVLLASVHSARCC